MILKSIEKLLCFAVKNLHLDAFDLPHSRNALYFLLKVEGGADIAVVPAVNDEISDILEEIYNYILQDGELKLLPKDVILGQVIGCVLPSPSHIKNTYQDMINTSADDALEKFYDFCIKSDYIKMRDIKKNIFFKTQGELGEVEITINLSKPEKDNKEIAMLKTMKASSYPKCMLCKENVGFSGRANYPSRKNLRTLPIVLGGENWFFQYSPYVYYNQHCIAIAEKHSDMIINRSTLEKIFDFVEQFPTFFIGSNADLPIVGGSIINHEHFQGGKYLFPMQKSKIRYELKSTNVNGVTLSVLDWYNSVIRVEGKNRDEVIVIASKVIENWKNYSDEENEIIAKTDAPHNTVTPIGRFNSEKYSIDLILRNNRTNSEHPEGIFHAHKQRHHIKKEGIGIIEVMGLFILPGRLERELKEAEQLIMSGDVSAAFNEHHPLYIHREMLKSVAFMDGDISKNLLSYVKSTCIDILCDTAVFKNTKVGNDGIIKFIKTL